MHKPLLWTVIVLFALAIVIAVAHIFSPFAFHFGAL